MRSIRLKITEKFVRKYRSSGGVNSHPPGISAPKLASKNSSNSSETVLTLSFTCSMPSFPTTILPGGFSSAAIDMIIETASDRILSGCEVEERIFFIVLNGCDGLLYAGCKEGCR